VPVLPVVRVAAAVLVQHQPAEVRLRRPARVRRVAAAPLVRWREAEARLAPLALTQTPLVAAPARLRQTDFAALMSASRYHVVRCQIDET